MMARVFITQRIRADFSPAAKFGEVVFVTAPHDDMDRDQAALVLRIEESLKDFDAQQDYLVLTGSPYINAAVMLTLGHWGIRDVNFLRWNNMQLSYTRLPVRLPSQGDIKV